MNILFDQGTPVPLRAYLRGHLVSTAFEKGWATLKNGELLAAAENNFDLFITTDKQLKYQQRLVGRKMAILVLPSTSWPSLQALAGRIQLVVENIAAGEYIELSFD
ncbi:MAG TPA: hypothetical protein VI306_01425 [Pyrinomonadaceae bacterium]